MKRIGLLSLPLMLVFAACSTSRINNSYANNSTSSITDSYTNNYKPATAKRILVLALFSDKNNKAKVAMENELAKDLSKFGYDAVTATDDFGASAFSGMTEPQAIQKLHDEGIQNVVTITLVDKNKQKRYVPSTYGYSPGFWGYYSYYSPWGYNPYRPGYTEVNTSYVFETNLYDVSNNQLLYSAQSKTVDASSMATLANDYARSVVRDMKRKNVLG